MLRTGQYINICGEDLEYDAYIMFGEAADEITPEEASVIEEKLTPVIAKTNWSKAKRRERCESILDDVMETADDAGEESILGWGYDVIIIK